MPAIEIFLIFFRLGLTSFGGPIAHLGYFHDEFVNKRKWITEQAYADLVALCQFLPGPASSQVGIALGLSRRGIIGAIMAWLGFTLPSAFVLTLCGLGLAHLELTSYQAILHTLKIVAVSVVADAVLSMGKKLCPDKERITLMILAALAILFIKSALAQIVIILLSGICGILFLTPSEELPHTPLRSGIKKRMAAIFLSVFVALLFILPTIRVFFPVLPVKLMDSFYRTGSLVFGGGHVVLPLLQSEVIATNLISKELFMAGYGLAQIIPGPLFTFSAYLGAVAGGIPGAIICLISAFLPSFLLIIGGLPFWEQLRNFPLIRKAMLGINASVVGILLAALYQPVWTSAIFSFTDFILASFGLFLLRQLKFSPWLMTVLIFLGTISIMNPF